MLKKYLGFIICIVLATALMQCATVASPGGGPRDSLPPVFINSIPKPFQTNFKGGKATLNFKEYIQLKDQQKLFFMSPPAGKRPLLTVKGKSVVVEFEEPLDSNSTYRLDFGSSIADNNEGNRLDNFSIVFSTGDYIDSLIMAGQVIDAHTRDTAVGAYLFYFDPKADSLTLDSTMFKARAEALFRADSSGYFFADILKDKDYRIYAMLDKNDNQRYESGVDKVAFLDSVYNPTKFGEINISFDDKGRIVLDSVQKLLEVFKEEPRKRQTVVEHKRPLRQRFNIVFNAPDAIVDTLKFDSIDDSRIIKVWNKTKDSLSVWIKSQTQEELDSFKDSIKVRIAYQRPDSVWNYTSYGQDLVFVHKIILDEKAKKAAAKALKDETKAKEDATKPKKKKRIFKCKHKLRRQQIIDSSIVDSTAKIAKIEQEKSSVDTIAKDSVKKVNPFKITVKASKEFVPVDDLGFEFEYPLTELLSDKITLEKIPKVSRKGKLIKDEKAVGVKVPFTIVQDTLDILKYKIKAHWDEDIEYELVIPDKVFSNIALQTNDTLQAKFTVMPRSKYGTITIKPIFDTAYKGSYIIQLLPPKESSSSGGTEEKEDKIVRQTIIKNSADIIKFEYLPVGKYRVRIIQDINNNKKWDTGDLVLRRKPEKSRLFVDKFNSNEIISKENWEIEIDLDLKKMFNN